MFRCNLLGEVMVSSRRSNVSQNCSYSWAKHTNKHEYRLKAKLKGPEIQQPENDKKVVVHMGGIIHAKPKNVVRLVVTKDVRPVNSQLSALKAMGVGWSHHDGRANESKFKQWYIDQSRCHHQSRGRLGHPRARRWSRWRRR